MNKIFNWITDPATSAKKRTIVSFLAALACGVKASTALLAFVCASISDTSMVYTLVCTINTSALADLLNGMSVLIDQPATSFIGFVAGSWALISGYKKDIKAAKESQNG